MLAEGKHNCITCGKSRICVPDDPNAKNEWDTEWQCKMECVNLTAAERRKVHEDRWNAPPPPRKPRFAYPIIGGPLDGEYATTADFEAGPRRWEGKREVVLGPPGMYHHLDKEYHEFNSAGYSHKKIGGHPSMIYVHVSLIKPLINPRDR